MKLKLFFTSLYFYEYPLEKIFRIASDLKFTGIEINPELYNIWFAKNTHRVICQLRELKESYNLDLSLHAPFIEINLLSYNQAIRKVSEMEIYKWLVFSDDIGINTITLHFGTLPFGFEFKKEVPFINEFYREGIKALKRLYSFAEDREISLGIENLHSKKGKFPKLASHFDVISQDIRNLKITFDLAHAFTISDNVAWNLMRRYNNRIINIHVSDVDKITNTHHIGIGSGKVDFKKFFRLLEQNDITAPIVIELSATATCKERFNDESFRINTLQQSKEKLEKIYKETI